ncbi:MAG: histone deacetylase [Lentisphaerae bacterium RIFOXYC12_FULL_60_16]|nr:MAG: histone deacetylase [Lentisphaerae bacterium RIFOXYC12_FULL_60_16]OGV79383.1 MAG: histone deacetylase [Lentisphaerae bacterium RIFOXYB12_FULL_60_10]
MTGIVFDPVYREHDPGPGHPESPSRLDAVWKGIEQAGVKWLPVPARPASEAELAYCHTADYIRGVRRDVASDVGCLSTGDTDCCPRSFEVARLAVGGVLNAVEAVINGRVSNAFCAVRPPGHHATADRGMGFCIFNNVAVAARALQRHHGVRRILIVDWDVHHGNGTQELVNDDPDIAFFSTHQWPAYPGTGRALETGAGAARGTKFNCPLPAGSGRHEVVGSFDEKLVPAMQRFKPEFVLVSAGFDGRRGDPIGGFELTDQDFTDLTRRVLDLARAHAGGRVVSVLEGGYHLEGLASAVAAHVRTLSEA